MILIVPFVHRDPDINSVLPGGNECINHWQKGEK